MGTLYERYKQDVFAYFYRCTSDQGRSAMARNLYIDHVRRKDPLLNGHSLEGAPIELDNSPNPHLRMEYKERAKLLHTALAQLSPEKKEAIILSRFQGLKYREIAQMCNCSENAIKSRIQRGLLELKEILESSQA